MITVLRCADIGLKGYMLYDDWRNNVQPSNASTIDKVIATTGFILQSFGYVGEFAGYSNETLKNIKFQECLVRIVDIPVKYFKATNDIFEVDEPDFLRILNKGVVMPFLSFTRAAAEYGILDGKAYFDLPLEERAHKTRPKYEPQGRFGYRYLGEETIDPQKLQQEIEHLETQVLPTVHFFEVAASFKLSKDQEKLAFAQAIIQQHGHVLNLQAINYAQQLIAILQQNNQQNSDPFDLVQREDIPDFLDDDEIFAKYKCPITARPIRDPVGDPTTRNAQGMTLYERTAIVEALENNEVSPTTRVELTEDELVEQPFIRALIDERLRFYSAELRNHAQSRFRAPANQAALQAAQQENPRY